MSFSCSALSQHSTLVLLLLGAFALPGNISFAQQRSPNSPPPIPTETASSTAPNYNAASSGYPGELRFAPDSRRPAEQEFGPSNGAGLNGSDARGLDRLLNMTQRVKGIIGDRGLGSEANQAGTRPAGNARMRLTDDSVGSFAANPVGVPSGGEANADLASRRSQAQKEIVERIELLKRLRAESTRKRMEAIPAGESLIPGPQDSPAGQAPANPGNPIPGGQFVTSESGAANAMMGLDADNAAGQMNMVAEVGNDASPFGDDVEQLFPAPVDAMQLGESLFRTKNYAAALKAFESVEVEKLTDSEHVWLDLLMALTKRRLGILDEAEEELRDIANIKSRDNSVPTARFWLKQTEFTRKTRPLLDQLNDEYEMLVERAKDYAKSQ
ncbi:MAG: hypothetical protein AAGG44_05640 [Planctomycetota bacterium]